MLERGKINKSQIKTKDFMFLLTDGAYLEDCVCVCLLLM